MGLRTLVTFVSLLSYASADLSVSYSVWIGESIDMTFTADLESPDGSFFSDVMEQASLKNPFFQYSCGAGFNDSDFNAYDDRWLLFEMPTRPYPCNMPTASNLAQSSVDTLAVRDGYHYLFWYNSTIPLPIGMF